MENTTVREHGLSAWYESPAHLLRSSPECACSSCEVLPVGQIRAESLLSIYYSLKTNGVVRAHSVAVTRLRAHR